MGTETKPLTKVDKIITGIVIITLFFCIMIVMIINGLDTIKAMLMSTLIIGFTFVILWFNGNIKLAK